MTFSDLVKELKKLKMEQKRVDESDKLEFVLRRDYVKDLNAVLENYYGPALKPEGAAPSRAAEERSSLYGGIWKNQTLYHVSRDGENSLTIIWPWSDNRLVTVKVFLES